MPSFIGCVLVRSSPDVLYMRVGFDGRQPAIYRLGELFYCPADNLGKQGGSIH